MQPTLKYLFTATFADGTVIAQSADDRSTIDPDKRSRFFDVLQKSNQSLLVRFELNEVNGPGQYAVDLTDGHFEVNGTRLLMHTDEVYDFEIVYFRVRKETVQGKMAHGFIGDMKHVGSEVAAYRIGWKQKSNQNYQRVMQIN